MLCSGFLLASLGATLGVHVVETKDVPLDRALELAHQLGDELRRAQRDHVVVSSLLWDECREEAACVRELALRDSAAAVIILRMYATPNLLLLTATRARADGAAVLVASRRLSGEPAGWKSDIASLARELSPPAETANVAAAPPLEVKETPPDGTPWLLIGLAGGVALAGAGAGFAASSYAARQDLLEGQTTPSRIADLTARMDDGRIAANLFFTAAIVTVAAGIVLDALAPSAGETQP